MAVRLSADRRYRLIVARAFDYAEGLGSAYHRDFTRVKVAGMCGCSPSLIGHYFDSMEHLRDAVYHYAKEKAPEGALVREAETVGI